MRMLEALANIEPTVEEASELVPAVHCLVGDAARLVGPLSPGAWLSDSWAGRLYHDMSVAVAG
jgi:hypothetical protein